MSYSINKSQSHLAVPNGSQLTYRTFNNKVVEAKLKGTEVLFGFEKFLSSVVSDARYFHPKYSSKTKVVDSYYGRAYCNTDMGDVFDEEKGKEIARDRCLSLFRSDFDEKIVALLEDLHRIEARIFNRLRKNGRLNLYLKARGVDEIYNDSFRMEGQPDFFEVLSNNKDYPSKT